MVLVADELKKKRAEIGLKVEEMRAQIVALEQQQAAFDHMTPSLWCLTTALSSVFPSRNCKGCKELTLRNRTTSLSRLRVLGFTGRISMPISMFQL